MEIPVSEIKINKRVRYGCEGVEDLMESISKHGLLNPITINEKKELVAGFRRLEAVKRLGWTTISAEMICAEDRITNLEIELEENTERLPFTEAELAEGLERLKKLQKKSIWNRIKNIVTSFLEDSFDSRQLHKAEKKKKNGMLSFLMLAGIIIIVLGGVCSRLGFISDILHSILDVISFAAIVIGGFYFIKFCAGSGKQK